MGCTPSIHVSQTGIVYCRDSDESSSRHSSVITHRTGNTQLLIKTETNEALSVTARSNSSIARKTLVERRGTISISEAETQTTRNTMKGSETDISYGPMKLRQHSLSVLLVFGKEDAQSDGFWWAADKAGYKCNITRNSEAALECFLDKQHDVVIIDSRQTKYFDPEALCRSLRSTKTSMYSTILAVTRKAVSDKDESPVLPLLNAGFNRRFTENHNVGTCLNELLSLERNEVRMNLKLRASEALFTALEHVSDAVEIMSKESRIQYVNPAFEKMTGYSTEEAIGKDSREFSKSEKNISDVQENIHAQLKKGKKWEGTCHLRKKSGETITYHSQVAPVEGAKGKVQHIVSVKSGEISSQLEKHTREGDDFMVRTYTDDIRTFTRKTSIDVKSLTSDGGFHVKRRESYARIHSLTVEAPITKIINIINAAQEDSPVTVAQALDHALEILRTTELYSPNMVTQTEDQMTSDLVGGLMSGARRRQSVQASDLSKQMHHCSPSRVYSIAVTQVPPEINMALERETEWDFDILNLERVTEKRPLLYLGLKTFCRFGALEFFKISETVMTNWLQEIERNYHASNTYHNSTHASDVMHCTAYFLEKEKLKLILDQSDRLAALIAAVVHDVDHPGKTNPFLINSGSELATLYNDVAVLESHHAALAFRITTSSDRVNIFKNLSRSEFRTMRQMVIDMVLATEMSKHFEHLSKFDSCCTRITHKNTDADELSNTGSPDSSLSSSVLMTNENKVLIKRMVIKCADVSNPLRPIDICKVWACRIAEEYFLQTDEEKSKGLPVVMPIFDRKTCSIPKSQTSFIDYFITNMFETWDAFLGIPELLDHLQINYKHWEAEHERTTESKNSSTIKE